jgi:uracil-DNA glycosylase
VDAPKTLASNEERESRHAMLLLDHVAPLARLVQQMRQVKGPEFGIPHFDPLDGGINAEILFLLEAPGPKAVASGFISRNNPDETAKNFFLLNVAAGIDRRCTVTWNAVPWYIGSGSKIRAATPSDVREADHWLKELLELLPRLRFVVFVGKKSLYARVLIQSVEPRLLLREMPHPSPMFINRAPGNRDRILAVMNELSAELKRDA